MLVERDQRAERPRRQFLTRMVVVGRLPGNTLCGTSQSGVPSASTSSAVLPNASASVWAKKFASSISWWSPSGFWERQTDEVARDQPRALVDQLVERVLAVGARLAPDDRARVDSRRACRRASTRLPLLSMSSCWKYAGKRLQVLVVGQDRVGLRRRRSSLYQTPSSPSITGRLRSSGAVRKCSSISWTPSSISAKLSVPIAIIGDRPIADHSE